MVVPRDAQRIYAAGFIRSASVSLVGVTLAIYLARVGFSLGQIGLLIGVGLVGSAVATVFVSVRGDGLGRRRTLIGLTLLTMLGYVALATFTDAAALVPFAFVGMLNGMGRDRGAVSSLEQAMLPETVPANDRTWVLAWYNLVLDGGHAIGALAAAAPSIAVQAADVSPERAHRLMFLLCAGATLLSLVPYLALTPRVEMPAITGLRTRTTVPDRRSRRVITRLALLFGLDSFGGGFLNSSLIAYWFFTRYGTSEAALAVLFFAARVLNALSHVVAAWLAPRIGLLNTMVWTHLPSSLFLIAAPASPSASMAAALFLAREALVEMDVPTRQSYVMAVVDPSERTFASGVTNVTRHTAWAIGPSVAGFVMQHVTLAGPLIIGGTLKIAYDLLLYRAFRHVRPPEEDSAESERKHS